MRLLGQILVAFLVIAALQGMLAVLALGLMLLLIWGLLFRTCETVGLLVFLLYLKALGIHPWLTVGSTAVLLGLLLIGRSKGPHADRGRRNTGPKLLPPPDQAHVLDLTPRGAGVRSSA